MVRFVQKWVGKVSKNDAKRIEPGSKMEAKWVQKSSKIDAKIEVGKKIEKRDAPDSSGLWIFGRKWSKTVQNGILKIMKKSKQRKYAKMRPRGRKGMQNAPKMAPEI